MEKLVLMGLGKNITLGLITKTGPICILAAGAVALSLSFEHYIRVLWWTGRLHPLLIHFPIALILAAMHQTPGSTSTTFVLALSSIEIIDFLPNLRIRLVASMGQNLQKLSSRSSLNIVSG